MSRIKVKRVFIVDKSYYFVYVGPTFVCVLTSKPSEKETRNLIAYRGPSKDFRNSSLKFLNEIAVEVKVGSETNKETPQ